MYIAVQEHKFLQVIVRRNGKFAEWSDTGTAYALMEFGWEYALPALADAARNKAAVAALDGDVAAARKWLDRAETMQALANE